MKVTWQPVAPESLVLVVQIAASDSEGPSEPKTPPTFLKLMSPEVEPRSWR